MTSGQLTVEQIRLHDDEHDGGGDTDVGVARRRRDALLAEGVSFPTAPPGTLPWLMAVEPFALGDELTRRITELGAAVFALVDVVQRLYAEGHPVVLEHLDPGTVPDLRGLELDRWIETFRLDLVLENGHPVITEVEEVYGNAGKAHAMQAAYGVNYDKLFAAFVAAGVSHVLVDDQVRTYGSELELLRRALRARHDHEITVQYLSDADLDHVEAAWRFCYATDLAQYPAALRQRITGSGIHYVNPLFHGYGTKALLALVWHPGLHPELLELLGEDRLALLRAGTAQNRLLGTEENLSDLADNRRDLVIKVTDSPSDRSMTWGSRGVHFGDSSAARWATVLAGVRAGHLPGRPTHVARYAVSRLIDSDRFDVTYLHPDGDRLALMRRARIRLAPIFFRTGTQIDLVAGHATFVNTSRKVHLGRHAVCAPLDWPRPDEEN